MKKVSKLQDLPHKILEAAQEAGLQKSEKERSGSFVMVDHSTVIAKVNKRFEGKLEIMDTKDALKKYEWLRDYRWGLVDRDKDEYTRQADEEFGGGYFLRILPGAKVEFPLQSCLMISKEGMEQSVHNIIIAEEGSDAKIITGCTTHPDVKSGQHIGISEFFIKKGAKLNFTMIHNWNEGAKVRPRSAAMIEDGGTFVSNYVLLKPVKDIQMYPAAVCSGKDSVCRMTSIIYGTGNSLMDIGSRIELSGKGSRGEVISRVIAKDSSRTIARGMLIGNTAPCKAHLECRGLLMSDRAEIHAIPELIGRKKDVDLSHEAAVGKIAEKEIIYLMSRGLGRDDATSVIVRGFLDVNIMGLPRGLAREIESLLDIVSKGL
ncbi:MAG: SufD family Fe-S cluster assembly protein [Candidatus Altiarchaeales archaeon]|nr:SufD family Fe-S cluster assembly protein [Candidatus Altiarchaeota archaeon]MBU4341372.1 SufD family Fe-S cluster assembly protein [Candidatus Altiarchaeota archaeon]MBU4436835.1 SufD family Fe-S cluster assembly protein [Candidatus Altiarchaeota archaeon]MCG2782978.1 SufD family Fe-S cluster assembly protein [Candidatus Altiarchaeales archaeon]